MSGLELFDFGGQELRVVLDSSGEPWFVAADIAAALGYQSAKDATRLLDADMKGGQFVPTLGGNQQMIVISEPGLYRLIMRSQRPNAREFERKVVTEILPAIRKTGTYAIPLQRAEPALPGNYLEALKALVSTVERAESAEAQVAELEPAARLAQTVMSADGDWSVREAAQVLNRDPAISTGQRRLFATLRELRWVDARGVPYQAQIENGRLSTRVRVYDHPHTGEPTLADPQIRITGKGLARLHQHLGGQAEISALVAAT